MKVLVACEESQRVCITFRERGHEAYSCDLKSCTGGFPDASWNKKHRGATLRSKTFPGIAQAIANQWG